MDSEHMRPEEADCDLVEVQGGYCLEGYDADALKSDYPRFFGERGSEYIQRLAGIWHSRFVVHNACFPAACERTLVLGIPHPRHFVDRGIPFVAIPSSAFASLVAVDMNMGANVGVCVMAIDLCTVEEEDSFYAVHVGSFSYIEFMKSLEPCSLGKEFVNLGNLYECWEFGELGRGGKGVGGKAAGGEEEWISAGCIDIHFSFSHPLSPPKPISPRETEEEIKIKRKRELERRDRIQLRQWLPDHRCIPQEDRPRTLWRAYNGGFQPAYTRLKDEAQEYAAALGMGCFAYDFFKFNKRYLIATWDAAYKIVTRRSTYTRPSGDRALLKEGRGRHLYEGMLPEFPQKLILDLEFYREKNPTLDTDQMTRYAMEYTSMFLQKLFDYTPAEEDWIVLDASSKKKASRHVILNAPKRYFRNMHDSTYFRDIMKAYMEVGIMSKDSSVTRLLVQAEPKRDKHGAIVDLPIADQVMIEGKWYTSFIDWSIVNHSFRLMRTYRATKYGDDSRPFVEASMNKQRYTCDRDLFVNSLVSSVFPIPEIPEKGKVCGWKVSMERAQEVIQQARALLVSNGVVSSAFEPLVNDETRAAILEEFRERGIPGIPGVGKGKGRKRKAGTGRGFSRSFLTKHRDGPRPWTHGYLRKQELDASSLKHGICVRLAHEARPDLDQLIEETNSWRVWAVCDATTPDKNSFAYPKYYYIASRDSAYCPILGSNHTNKGKMIIIINQQGFMSAKCLGGSCQAMRWNLGNKRLSRRVLSHLWCAEKSPNSPISPYPNSPIPGFREEEDRF
jgi:hypothetical protein